MSTPSLFLDTLDLFVGTVEQLDDFIPLLGRHWSTAALTESLGANLPL